ncbi:hypothetical protein C8R44DRAFT_849044 [Mycena epipterygia]|nr:hypothetical protein C8R44DRAFT_849044 [Mycena epipterygia]
MGRHYTLSIRGQPDCATEEQLSLPIIGVCTSILAASRDPIVSLLCVSYVYFVLLVLKLSQLEYTREIMHFTPSQLPAAVCLPLSFQDTQLLLYIAAQQIVEIYKVHRTLQHESWIDSDHDLSNCIRALRMPTLDQAQAAPSEDVRMKQPSSGLPTPPPTQQAITEMGGGTF